ncbi:MAG: molybdate transport system substrate-binding protein [Thermoproteota archaeon]|nr:molybdate transport system substrate-binding protein [Thermoproteota archaeon]
MINRVYVFFIIGILIGFLMTVAIAVSGITGYTLKTTIQMIQKPELRVFIASSLLNVVKNVSAQFEKEHNCTIIFNSAGSDSLTQQIQSGSPADVFMAADFKWTKQLQTQGLLYGDTYWNFTTNKLVVALPIDNTKNLTSLADLTHSGVNVIVAAWTVPAGSYTNKTLIKISTTWGNPTNPSYKGTDYESYRDKIIANIISYETSVQNIVGKLKLGVADAGFVYTTDVAFQGNALKYIPIPSDVNTIGTYGISVISSTKQQGLASLYTLFWLSSEGQTLLKQFGFSTDISKFF